MITKVKAKYVVGYDGSDHVVRLTAKSFMRTKRSSMSERAMKVRLMRPSMPATPWSAPVLLT